MKGWFKALIVFEVFMLSALIGWGIETRDGILYSIWSSISASSNVDMAGYDIDDVGNITVVDEGKVYWGTDQDAWGVYSNNTFYFYNTNGLVYSIAGDDDDVAFEGKLIASGVIEGASFKAGYATYTPAWVALWGTSGASVNNNSSGDDLCVYASNGKLFLGHALNSVGKSTNIIFGTKSPTATNTATMGSDGAWSFPSAMKYSIETPDLVGNSYSILSTQYRVIIDDDDAQVSGVVVTDLGTAAASSNRVVHITKGGSSHNISVVSDSGTGTISGSTNQVISTQYDNITVHSDGLVWWLE